MPNGNERVYKTLVTTIGKSKIAAVIHGSEKVNITQMAVGDGNGTFYVPTADMTALVHEVWRGNIAGKWINEHSANMVDVKVVLPADVGGFTVREVALFDEDNNMIAIGNVPDTEKAVITTGAAGTLTLVMHIVLTDVDAVEFKIDPHLDVITGADLELAFRVHDADLNAHPGLLRAKKTSYSNNKTKIEAENVQDALDTLLGETLPKLTVKAAIGSSITIKDSKTTLTGKIGSAGTLTVSLPRTGTWTATATLNDETATETINAIEIGKTYTLNLPFVKIYGVVWDKTESSALSRTDDAALFGDPTPALSGGIGNSPFDSLAPWSGIVKEEIDGNVLVKIPKYWYKWTDEGTTLKLQIANKAAEGFHISPAHADRNDGKGERDFVYIGRYKCNENYKSVTGNLPKVNITREEARKGIAALGKGYSQEDFAMFWTIRMLYLVEFADWNAQKVIGYNCGNDESVENTGASDTIQYHTGTKWSSRTEYGVGVQYRWIEDPWGNVAEWCDGIRFDNLDMYVFNNPAEFDDTEGGTKVATLSALDGWITEWAIPTVNGMEWALYPSNAIYDLDEEKEADPPYIGDYCYFSDDCPVLAFGGVYGQYPDYGAFLLLALEASDADDYLGARLQYLP